MGKNESANLIRRHLLTVADYYRMAEAGVLAPDARVELIDGEIVDMAPIGTRHGSAVLRLTHLCTQAAGSQATVSVQNSLRLGDRSEPQPDVMLLKPREDFYAQAHPTAEDVLLLIEVSDSTARYDREIKLPLYARHGVQEVWIVDLEARLLRSYSAPVGELYTAASETATPGLLPVLALPGISIDTTHVLV
jgi:Uma2 family endonuclease